MVPVSSKQIKLAKFEPAQKGEKFPPLVFELQLKECSSKMPHGALALEYTSLFWSHSRDKKERGSFDRAFVFLRMINDSQATASTDILLIFPARN